MNCIVYAEDLSLSLSLSLSARLLSYVFLCSCVWHVQVDCYTVIFWWICFVQELCLLILVLCFQFINVLMMELLCCFYYFEEFLFHVIFSYEDVSCYRMPVVDVCLFSSNSWMTRWSAPLFPWTSFVSKNNIAIFTWNELNHAWFFGSSGVFKFQWLSCDCSLTRSTFNNNICYLI